MPIFANDFSGIGAQLANQEAQRQQASQAALAMLMQGLGRMQQQKQFEAQLAEKAQTGAEELAQRKAERQGTLDYQNRALNLSKEYQDWLMKQPTKLADKNIMERQAAANKEIAAGTFDPSNYSDLPPEHLDPLTRMDAAQRQSDASALATSKQVADAANFLKRYDSQNKAIAESPSQQGGFNLYGVPAKPAPSDEAAKRVEALRMNIAPLVHDPKLKIVEVDPATGKYVPPTYLIKPWMTMGTNTPAGVVGGRQLNMASGPIPPPAPPFIGPPRPLNIATPPTTMTGTNRPPFVRQNGIVFRLMPDGSYQPAQ